MATSRADVCLFDLYGKGSSMTQQLKDRKETIYQFICDDLYTPMKIKEIAILLGIPRERRAELSQVLDELVDEGKIVLSKRGKYSKAEPRYLTGIYRGNPKGFGFVTVEGDKEDVYIPEDKTNGALHQDTVEIELLPGSTGKRKEGRVVRVLARGVEQVVGMYENSGSYGFVVPDNLKISQDIFIPLQYSRGAVTGHKVVARITDYGNGKNRNPEGQILEILGHIHDPGVDILSIIRAYDLPTEFSEKVKNQAERTPDAVSTADMAGRMDLRDWQMVTIDGEDAKDLDDAVSVTEKDGQYILGVHIADVSNYVQEKSALDREAYERGTSVYLADRVIPMLPHKLSNGICSLNAGEDRLALSCMMTIDGKGNVVSHKIAETVIHVDQRMSYTSVKKILADQDPEEIQKYEPYVPMFQRMEELAKLLRKKRQMRGSIDFDFPETRMVLDEKGHPLDIRPYERNVATRIIEEFMLIANETVAEDYFWQELPFVYRTHDAPDPEKILKLSAFINNFGYSMRAGKGDVHPKELQKLLERVEDTPEEALISRLTLRSMKQAKYTTCCTGHFGLSTPYYCHFTSPIRRYPDLQIHRIIKDNLRGRMNENRIAHYQTILEEVAKHSSETERRADEAERETVKQKKVEYMNDHMGECFEGVISGVTSYGLYVELPNTIEGLVHVSSLTDGYYVFHEDAYELAAEENGRSYKLGQKVRIRVTGTDPLMRTIDFELDMPDGLAGNKEEDQDGKGACKADCQ